MTSSREKTASPRDSPSLSLPDLLRDCGGVGVGNSRGHCTEGGRLSAMQHEPFFWILVSWWVIFLLCLLLAVTGSVKG